MKKISGLYCFDKRISFKINVSVVVYLLAAIIMPCSNAQNTGSVQSFGGAFEAKRFYSSTIDEDNNVWFLTEIGIVSFDGTKWSQHIKNPKVASTGLNGIIYDKSLNGSELLIATHKGATVASLPFSPESAATMYSPENSKILSENVLALATGKKDLRWFGTDKGISAVKGKNWLTNSYDDRYPESLFEFYKITSMATSKSGDSLFVGTKGSGVMRLYRDDVDAVSGASEFLAWGPILMPSDSVYCIHISASGTQWIGTDNGVARHKGSKTLEGWTIFTTDEGLADNFVQAIGSDSKGKIYIGTKNGLSVFDGDNFNTYRRDKGLISNNILSIATDRNDVVWLGTDNGVTCIINGKFISYQ